MVALVLRPSSLALRLWPSKLALKLRPSSLALLLRPSSLAFLLRPCLFSSSSTQAAQVESSASQGRFRIWAHLGQYLDPNHNSVEVCRTDPYFFGSSHIMLMALELLSCSFVSHPGVRPFLKRQRRLLDTRVHLGPQKALGVDVRPGDMDIDRLVLFSVE